MVRSFCVAFFFVLSLFLLPASPVSSGSFCSPRKPAVYPFFFWSPYQSSDDHCLGVCVTRTVLHCIPAAIAYFPWMPLAVGSYLGGRAGAKIEGLQERARLEELVVGVVALDSSTGTGPEPSYRQKASAWFSRGSQSQKAGSVSRKAVTAPVRMF